MINFLFNKLIYRKLVREKQNANIFGFHDEKYINEIVKTKKNEYVLISYPSDLSAGLLTIYLLSFVNGKRHHAHMYIHFTTDTMFIADIAVLDKSAFNRGYGSLLIEKALDIARIKGVSFVTGKMAFSSPEQKQRQIHYYSKYGFQIDENYKLKLVL